MKVTIPVEVHELVKKEGDTLLLRGNHQVIWKMRNGVLKAFKVTVIGGEQL